jgi:tetratricopeptide (TPR) repeat protein
MASTLLAFPSLEDLTGLTQRREGSLSEVGLPLLLLALARTEKSAVLRLKRGVLQKEIILEEGAPVDCRSNVASESLGRFLVSQGKLTEAEFQASQAEAAARGLALEEILTERSVVSPSELFRNLQQNLARKLLDAFTWQKGSYEISYDVPPVESPLRVKVPQLVLTGIYKFGSQANSDAAVEGLAAQPIGIHPAPLFSLDEVRLTGDMERVRAALTRPRMLAELPAESGVSAEECSRIVHALALLGIVATEDRLPAPPALASGLSLELDLPVEKSSPEKRPAVIQFPAAAQTAAQEKGTAAVSSAKLVRKDEELIRLFLGYRRKDPFELLGIEDDASIGQIVQAWFRFAERYAPWTYGLDAPDGLREKAQEVFLAAARAYAELADAGRRKELIERKRRGPGRRRVDGGDPAEMLDPEANYRRGRELFESGRPREALSWFEMAVDCDSLNGTYAAELAWCRFHLLASTAAQTLDTLRQVLRIDPRCGAAYLFTGKVHATLGNQLEAEGYIRKSMSLMGRDPRPGEALRALAKKG